MQREKLLLIPGPTPVHPRIIHALSQPTLSHVSPVFVEEFKEALDNLKKIVFCRAGQPYVVAGAGTLAMEMALLNTVGRGRRLLVLSQGYFGSRMKEIADSFDLPCDILESEWGQAVSPGLLQEQILKETYGAVVSTHVDTATGACSPVRRYAEIVRETDSLFIVDGVCATGGIEENMDEWGIDVVLTAAQKCFGVPPGLAVLVLSEEAMARRRGMDRVSAYYADLMRWLPIMKNPAGYFSTPCVNEIRGFLEGTRIILEEGLATRFKRHQIIARAFRAGLETLGFRIFTAAEFLADTLTVAYYPAGVRDGLFRSTLASNSVVVAGGLGPLSGKVFRMGHMGNLSLSQVEFALSAVEKTLSSLGHVFSVGSGVSAAKTVLSDLS
jgi:alanine-glyoxylate transaminase/serine-glyoxylate transaminase/serine-pyruvate transaminase